MRLRNSLFAALALWAAVAFLRIIAPSTLDDKDQPKVAFYTVDVFVKGRWILQHANGIEVATKPPLYQWIAGAISIAAGRLNDYTLLTPSLLFSLLALVVVWDWGRRAGLRLARSATQATDADADTGPAPALLRDPVAFSALAAFLAAMVWTLTYNVVRLSWTARTDMMVCALALAAVWAAGRLDDETRSPLRRAAWRWLAWALLTLGVYAKGPVALGIAFAMLGAESLARRTSRPVLALWPWFGIPIVLGLFALWFNAAYTLGGQQFWDTLVGNEVLQRISGSGARESNARPIYYFIPIFFSRALPWSVLLTLAGIYLLFAHRAPGQSLATRLRQLLSPEAPLLREFAWVVGIFLLFSIPKGKRPDYLLPVFAPAAVLLGVLFARIVAQGAAVFTPPGEPPASVVPRLLGATPRARFQRIAAIALLAYLGLIPGFWVFSEGAQFGGVERARAFAAQLPQHRPANSPAPLLFADSRNDLVQFYLKINEPDLSCTDSLRLTADIARTSPALKPAAWIVTRTGRIELLRKINAAQFPQLHLTEITRRPGRIEDSDTLILLRADRLEPQQPAPPPGPHHTIGTIE